MHPRFNSHSYNPNDQLNINGINGQNPHQVIGSQVNFGGSQMQARPQFQMGLLNSPQLVMPPFANNLNASFAPTQFFPFVRGPLQALNANNFASSAVNQPQFWPSGPLNVPNLVQNPNQLLQMQMMNCGPQNMGPFVNIRMPLANGNGILPQPVDGSGLRPLIHNDTVAKDCGPAHQQRNQNVFSPGAAKLQSNAGVVNGDNDGKSSWSASHNKNFTGNHIHDASQRGRFNQKQFHHRSNAQGSFKSNNGNGGKGKKGNGLKNFNSCSPFNHVQPSKKRSLMLNYSEQEIKQWREARRKNYPSNTNIEKKLKENLTQPEAMDSVAKMRRQQLKEILAKQAELGCEVAEVPSHYLSDSEVQTDVRHPNSRGFGKRGNFRSKFNQFDRFSKRQRSGNMDSENSQNQNGHINKKQRWANNGCTTMQRGHTKTEPSLLKKLLSSDIKRDKRHLLQVFRFMVMNSFFEKSPEQSLKFPEVIVKESCHGSEIPEEEHMAA
ncbi:Unknown protein [Striga hermonthica]|uniref:FMR1-interacting protein 1 conserved domain-containing protein n=1 Tax=Striga hermonthica TaxID=68872 RepID=A0A9N7NIR0_STRHE|nr:Unknown protein [Striga hermonthica]